MSPQQPFNLDFDKVLGQELIQGLQSTVGCFSCEKPNPSKTCSRCQVSMYCNTQCQKTDWKASGPNANDHKQLCSVYCENRDGLKGVKVSIPVCLYSIHEINEDEFVSYMRVRQDLFLLELRKCYQEQHQSERIGLSFQTAVIKLLGGKIRLAAAIMLEFDSKWSTVNHVLLETVDEGPAAQERLYPSRGGAGDISIAAEKKVLDGWIAFIRSLRDFCNVTVKSITFGRGLMFVANKGSFQESLEEANGGPIMWIPDREHSRSLNL
jgi:hypothetical protein